jgi:hypothetical protein
LNLRRHLGQQVTTGSSTALPLASWAAICEGFLYLIKESLVFDPIGPVRVRGSR